MLKRILKYAVSPVFTRNIVVGNSLEQRLCHNKVYRLFYSDNNDNNKSGQSPNENSHSVVDKDNINNDRKEDNKNENPERMLKLLKMQVDVDKQKKLDKVTNRCTLFIRFERSVYIS